MRTNPFVLALPALLGISGFTRADTIEKLDVTSTLGPNFFFDTAATGGSDYNTADASFIRNFGTANFNPASTEVTITGVGWASNAAAQTTTAATITITYLGSDGVVGGDDDQVIGSVTDTYTYSGAGEYAWKFATPMVATVGGFATNFLIRVQATGGNIVYKTTSGTTAATAKLSVAGSFAGGPLPDSDSDGLADVYENNTGVYVSALRTGTDPADPDTDDDGLPDGVETNTRTFVGSTNTGTNPLKTDSDNDGLGDAAETNTGTYASASDTGTNPNTRDRDNDRLSDKFEIDNGLDPFAAADFDNDSYPDALEVLFYGSDPKNALSFPGDGTSPAPGSFTAIQDAGLVSNPGELDLPSTLGTAIVNEAAVGGNVDADFATGVTNFVLHFPNAFPAPGSAVSITGFAWPVVQTTNANGDILLQFFDPGADGTVDGIDKDQLVGTARGTLSVTGTTTIMYWNFAPIRFTSSGTGLLVKIQSTAALRIKAQDNFAAGRWFANEGTSQFGNLRTSRVSIGGTALAPGKPRIVQINRTGNTTNLVWELNGAPSVTLQRSTSLDGFTDVPGKVNTTDTSYSEDSADPKAFFRLATP